MRKLKYCMWRFKIWNRWRKDATHYSAWEKFLVLLGKKMSFTFYGLIMSEGIVEGLRETGRAAKEASESLEKLAQAVKDKLDIVSPSHHRFEPKMSSTDNLDGYKVQTSIYDEIHCKENTDLTD